MVDFGQTGESKNKILLGFSYLETNQNTKKVTSRTPITAPVIDRRPTRWISLLMVIVTMEIPAIAIADNLIIEVKTCRMKLNRVSQGGKTHLSREADSNLRLYLV